MVLRRWVQVGRRLCLHGYDWMRPIHSGCLLLPKVYSSPGQLKLGEGMSCSQLQEGRRKSTQGMSK